MNVSVVIATCGDRAYADLALQRAMPSAILQGRDGVGQVDVLLEHFPGLTVAAARNELAARAPGDFLCFLDADDRLGDGYLQAMARAASSGPQTASEGHRLLVPAVQYLDEDGNCTGQPSIPAWGRPLIEVNCAVIGTLVPRELFLQVGGFDEWPLYEDWALWLKCADAGAELVPVPDAVYCAHAGVNGRNTSPEALETYWAIRRRHEDGFPWADVRAYKLG